MTSDPPVPEPDGRAVSRLSRLRADLRQRRHHRAFRIAPPMWERDLERLLAAADTEHGLDEHALADAATSLWRARRKLTATDSADARAARRYLRSCQEALTEAGVSVQEHDGEPYRPGRSLETVAFQRDPAHIAATVLETVRPTVYLHARRIQTGQVIVGAPEEAPDA